MLAANVRDIFGGLKMLVLVLVYSALDPPGVKEVRHKERRLQSGSDRVEMESSPAEIKNALRSPVRAEYMQEVRVESLIVDGIVAIKRGQSLSRSGARYVLVSFIAKHVSQGENRGVAENVGQLSKGLVVILNLENGSEILGLQAETLLDLVDAGRCRPETSGSIRAM